MRYYIKKMLAYFSLQHLKEVYSNEVFSVTKKDLSEHSGQVF